MSFSSSIPFSLFNHDAAQHSIGDLTSENKTFLWHQFMLDVLLSIPRSPTAAEDAVQGCHLLNTIDLTDQIMLQEKDTKEFPKKYATTEAINCYTHASFLFSALNKACRTLNSSAIIPFHSIVKDLDDQLKDLHTKQRADGTLLLPMTVYRAQTTWGTGELEKLLKNEGGLISMNTFLSTTRDSSVACEYLEDADKDTAVLFTITINDTCNDERLQTFADISKFTQMKDEKEVLFGMSSVFRVVSADYYDTFWDIQLELTSCEGDANVRRLTSELTNYLDQVTNKQIPFVALKQLFTRTSLGHAEPLVELVKYFLADVTQVFVRSAFQKQGRMKAFIEKEPSLRTLVERTADTDATNPSETSLSSLRHAQQPLSGR